MAGTKDDYDKSIHDPVDMTFADVTAVAAAMTKDKPAFIEHLYEMYVVHVALRNWAQALDTLRLIGEAQEFITAPASSETPTGTTEEKPL